ncbi:MAG: ribbon-helix-helix domain-containing protein [Vulcanisaeta sp.]|nr:ribbon-helix-helix domain-containing protein [Vulcanisaeta sp.]
MGTVNVTVRFNEEELHKLDELAQRMGLTRSDVVRSLINKFDEALKQEVDREGRRWFALGFVAALESAILDPEVILRFVRRNVDILGYPDFVIGMVKVRNRVVAFSHHDKLGHQLLSQVRSRIEEDVRKEEEEIEREGDEDEGRGGVRTAPAYVHIRAGVHPRTPRAIPVAAKYKLISNNKGAPPTVKPTAISTVGRVTTNNGGGAAKAVVAASMLEKQKLVAASQSNTGNPVNSQPRNPNPQASADGSGKDAQKPAGQGANHGLSGDFVVSLITNLYHKYRETLLKAVENVMGG